MKIKNIAVGSYIQSKKDSKQLIAGHCYQVAEKDVSDKTVRLFSVDDSFDDSLWFCVSDFRKPRPQLKQLDHSSFDHPYVDDRFKYVAINADGQAVFFESKPVIGNCLDIWVVHTGSVMPMLKGYDASTWQNSLIERDTVKELTGSDLARAMLARGDEYVMCLLSNDSDVHAKESNCTYVIRSFDESDCYFQAKYNRWQYAVPINNQGEPLTQAEVGL